MGRATNSPTASATPRTVAMTEIALITLICSLSRHQISNFEGSSVSPYTSALRIKIFEPVTSEDTKLTTPRTSGILEARRICLEIERRFFSTWILPSGSRTAVA